AIARLATHPARVLIGDGKNLPEGVEPLLGTLQPGAPGDVTVLDLDRELVVEPEKLHSRSKNTPFAGWKLRGAAAATIVGGRVLMRDGLLAEWTQRTQRTQRTRRIEANRGSELRSEPDYGAS